MPLMLPIHLFSCLELTHLKLENCLLHPSPTFCGFPNLLSLDLCTVRFGSGKCGEFITRCPLLEIMEIVSYKYHSSISKLNMDDIAKLENLKRLTLSLHELENRAIATSDIFQFLGFLPNLEELNLDFHEVVVEADTRKWVPTVFSCLKTLRISEIDFASSSMLSCVFEVIWGSPNLQELMMDADAFYVPTSELFSSDLGSNPVGQLQLQSVVISYFRGSKNEECLVKYLLACSPFLKTITIHSNISLAYHEKLSATMKLLKLHRASPVAEIDFY